MPAPPKPLEGIHAWTEAQIEAVVALRQEGRRSIGDAFRSQVIDHEGAFHTDLGIMIVPKERELQVSRMIGENRWTFLTDADRNLIDIIPATEDAAATLAGDDVIAEDDYVDHGEGAETLDPPPSAPPSGEEDPAPPATEPEPGDDASPPIADEPAPAIETAPATEPEPVAATAG